MSPNVPGGMTLLGDVTLEEACHWAWAMRSQMLKLGPMWQILPAAFRSRCVTLSYLPSAVSA